jgi:hypothetical protein
MVATKGGNPRDKWLPIASTTELIKETEVLRTLQDEKVAGWTKVDIDKMKDFVISQAPRLFSLLVYQGLVKLLKQFYQHNFDDRMFPIEFPGQRVGFDASSQFGDAIDSTVNSKNVNFGGLDIDDTIMENICAHWQWQFFVPVFREDSGKSSCLSVGSTIRSCFVWLFSFS